ncbi:MAG: hypothetical protein HYX60_06835 [Legionella longbeachae]|nr:hypothetical protein [Legionella longbeachae]
MLKRLILIITIIYWADYNADIKYVGLSFMQGEGGLKRVMSQLKNIAKIGTLTPTQANLELEMFFSSQHGKNIFKLAGFSGEELNKIKEQLKLAYAKIYLEFAPKIEQEITLDFTLQPSIEISPSSKSGSSRSSPRDEYLSHPNQAFDIIDQLELETFAEDLTKHCQSINKELLEDLQLEDFRKGLMLYHALRTVQQELELVPEQGQRFHKDILTNVIISKMLHELPLLQNGSTENELGDELLNKLLSWVKNSPIELDQWVEWVKVNGSRGLGSEIGLVRRYSGEVDLKQAVPQDDRKKEDGLAEINFDKVNLSEIFLAKEKPIKKLPLESEANELKELLSIDLQKLTMQQFTNHKLAKNIFQAKVTVIEFLTAVFSEVFEVGASDCRP